MFLQVPNICWGYSLLLTVSFESGSNEVGVTGETSGGSGEA